MYRIRLANGEEAAYRTVEELALAVRSGVVSPTAEVFHKAAGRWLPIETHPDYRAAVTGKRKAVDAHPLPAEDRAPQEPPTQRSPALPADLAPPHAMAAEPPAPAPPPLMPSTPEESSEQSGDARSAPASPSGYRGGPSRASRLRLMLAVAMGVSGVCLLGGGYLVLRPRLAPWLAQVSPPAAELREGMAPSDSTVPGEPDGPWADSPGFPAPPAPVDLPAAQLEAPPAGTTAPSSSPSSPPEPTRVSRMTAGRNAAPTYVEAYADARAEMDDAFGYIQFRRVFAPTRFSGPDSVRAARRMVAAAGNIVRVYRGREVMLEQSYRPDDPGGRGSLREGFETAEAARAFLANVDSLFGLLVGQQGRYSFDGRSIAFADGRTARRYRELRGDILGTLKEWQAAPDEQRGPTVSRLLQAFGSAAPPPAR